MKILAFAASNSKTSINKQFVTYATSVFKSDYKPDAEIEILDLADYELPFYRPDREEEDGVPPKAKEFYDKIGAADALIISFAEHNGFYTAAYKNLFDWMSRMTKEVFQGKPAVLLSASPGKGGAGNVLKTAIGSAGFFGMDVKASLSLPNFYDNFDTEKGILTDKETEEKLRTALQTLL
jgi:chromate reductase